MSCVRVALLYLSVVAAVGCADGDAFEAGRTGGDFGNGAAGVGASSIAGSGGSDATGMDASVPTGLDSDGGSDDAAAETGDGGDDDGSVIEVPYVAATDACDGQAVPLSAGSEASFHAKTTDLNDDYAAYCGRGSQSGADSVYAITSDVVGTLTASLEPEEGMDAVLYLSTVCGDPSAVIGCRDDGPLETESLKRPIGAGQTLYAVVDGRDETSGGYTLSLSLAAAKCGDGAVNEGEQCDFGPSDPNDGCGDDCMFEVPTDFSDQCPGPSTTLQPDMPHVIDSYTAGYADDYRSRCVTTSGAPDRVFAFTAGRSGQISVTLENASFDTVLYVFESCSDGILISELTCSDGERPADDETIDISVSGGETYFVVVDGFIAGALGKFKLTATLTE